MWKPDTRGGWAAPEDRTVNDISPISGPSFERAREVGPDRPQLSAAPARPGDRGRDRIELSDVARYLSQLQAVPEIRRDLVDRVRAEIAAGNYDTPERVDEAMRRAAQEAAEDLDLFA